MRFQCKSRDIAVPNRAWEWRPAAFAAVLRQSLVEALIPNAPVGSPRGHKKSGRFGRFPDLPWVRAGGGCLLALLAALAVRELFANASRFSRTIAQVIKLCPPHVALAFHFDTRNER